MEAGIFAQQCVSQCLYNLLVSLRGEEIGDDPTRLIDVTVSVE